MFKRRSVCLWLLLTGVVLLSACLEDNNPAEVTRVVTQVVTEVVTVPAEPVVVTRIVEEMVEVTVVPEVTTAPADSKGLVICLTNEPDSIFPYGPSAIGLNALSRQALQHAVYESLVTTRSYGYQAHGLAKLPSLEDGDAQVTTVSVGSGELVLNEDGQVVPLAAGVSVVDAAGNVVVFDDAPIEMAQLRVQFELKPMVWSDGTPVTAADSVFSFQVAADPITSVGKEDVNRTASYTALSATTLEWVGVPGWLDPIFVDNVWLPLPAHHLRDLSAQAMLGADETNLYPLSSGPFVIDQWLPGDQVHLVRNEFYYRAAEGLPYLDEITFKFVANQDQAVARLLSGQCDVVTQDSLDISQAQLLQEAAETGVLTPYFAAGNVFEHIDFGIDWDVDLVGNRPDWFGDVRVRQAITMCTDRQQIVDTVMYGQTEPMNGYVPDNHPYFPDEIARWPYDPDAGRALLEEAGFSDRNNDGTREEPRLFTPAVWTLTVDRGNETRQRIAAIFQENMSACGLVVNVVTVPAPELFDPRGPIFGRRFELVSFPWLIDVTPPCELYTGAQIPTPENGWEGNNDVGWQDDGYDAACAAATAAFWNSPEAIANHQAALQIFAENVPVIPLFPFVRVAATRPGVLNFQLDATQPSEMWNIYEWDIER